jgi:alanine dehydrogenase
MIVAVPKKTYSEQERIALIPQAILVLTKALMLYEAGKEMVRKLITALREQ